MRNRLKSAFEVLNSGNQSEIYILDEIHEWSETNVRRFKEKLNAIPPGSKVKLYINSPGGQIDIGLAVHNMIKPIASRVETHIIGMALSTASWIGMSANRVVMRRNALMMIHNPTTWGMGDEKDFESAIQMLKKCKDVIVDTYMQKSGKSKDEIVEMMDKTTWMTADEALEHGFIDEVADEDPELGMYDVGNLKKKLPANIYNSVLEWKNPQVPDSAGQCSLQNDLQPPNSEKREMKNLLKVLVENKVIASADADEAEVVIALKNSMSSKDLEIKNLKEQNSKLKQDAREMAKAAAEVAVNSYVQSGVIESDETEFWVENYLTDKDRTINVLDKRKPKSRSNEPLNMGNGTEPEHGSELEKLQNAYNKETDSWKRGELSRKIAKLESANQ